MIKLVTVLFFTLTLNVSNASEVSRVGGIQKITCNNIYKKTREPISEHLCNSFKSSGLFDINKKYEKLLTNELDHSDINLSYKDVKFYTEEGVLFTGGNPSKFFKDSNIEFYFSDFVVKFEVEPVIVEEDITEVFEPNSLVLFLTVVLIMLIFRRK